MKTNICFSNLIGAKAISGVLVFRPCPFISTPFWCRTILSLFLSFFVQGFKDSLVWEKIFYFRYSFPHSHFSSSSQYLEKFVNPVGTYLFLTEKKNSCSVFPLNFYIYLVRVDINTGWDRVCFPHLIFYLDIT